MKAVIATGALSSVLAVGLAVWFGAGAGPPSLTLTEDERAWLKGRERRIRLSPCPDYPPIDFVDSAGRWRGVTPDFVHQVEKQLGIRFEIVHATSWAEVLELAERRETDVVASIATTAERSKYLDFTRPYAEVKTVFVTRKEFAEPLRVEDLRGKTAAVGAGYAVIDYLQAHYPELRLVQTKNDLEALTRVSFRECDLMIADLPVVSFLIEHEGITNLKVAGDTGYSYPLGLATRNDWPALAPLLSRALAVVSQDQQQEISRRWIHLGGDPFYRRKEFWVTASAALGLVLLVIAQILLWNRALKRQVRQQTARLAASNSYLESVFNSIQSALILLDRHGQITRVNARAVELARPLAPTELEGRPAYSVYPMLSRYRELIDRVMTSAEPVELHREPQEGAHGRAFYSLRFAPISGSGGDVLVRIDDITTLELQNQQLARVQKLETIGTLASGLAHDFNNALGGITGTLSLMQDRLQSAESFEPGELDEYVEVMETSSRRATDTVKQLLSISRKQELSLVPVDLVEAVGRVLKVCRNTFDRAISLESELPDRPAMVQADASQLEQVLLNLCVNASHAMTIMRPATEPYGGRLHLSVRQERDLQRLHPEARPGDYWSVAVQDTGIGMAPATLAKIFDPFFTTKRQGEGTGLGLSMAYSIVKQHGGFLDVESEPGVGATFRCFLPALQGGEVREASATAAVSPRGWGAVLVVDDEAVMRTIAQSILERAGYTALLAEDGEEGIALFRANRERVRLVLLDMNMPKRSGKEAFDAIRALHAGVPVCVTSGIRRDERVEQMLAAGARFVAKPFSSRDLLLAVDAALSGRS